MNTKWNISTCSQALRVASLAIALMFLAALQSESIISHWACQLKSEQLYRAELEPSLSEDDSKTQSAVEFTGLAFVVSSDTNIATESPIARGKIQNFERLFFEIGSHIKVLTAPSQAPPA